MGGSTRNPLLHRGTVLSQDSSDGGILRRRIAGAAVQRSVGDRWLWVWWLLGLLGFEDLVATRRNSVGEAGSPHGIGEAEA